MTVRPKDPARLSAPLAELAQRLNVTQEQIDAASPSNAEWGSHERWLAEHQQFAALYPSMRGCSGLLMIVEHPGYPQVTLECDACAFAVSMPGALVAEHAARGAGFPVGLATKPFTPTEATRPAIAALRGFIDAPLIPGPCLCGPTGVGKTHLLARASLALRRHGRGLMWRTTRALFDQHESDLRSGHESTWKLAEDATVLVLDDVGAEQPTEARKGWLTALLDARGLTERPILASTNYAPEQWPAVLGDRAASRLCGLTEPVQISDRDWRSNRPQHQQER